MGLLVAGNPLQAVCSVKYDYNSEISSVMHQVHDLNKIDYRKVCCMCVCVLCAYQKKETVSVR